MKQCKDQDHYFEPNTSQCHCGFRSAYPSPYIDYVGIEHHRKQAKKLDEALKKIEKMKKEKKR